MKKKLLLLISLVSLLCTAGKCKQEPNHGPEPIMYYEFDETYTWRQIDSVCVVEMIPSDKEYWLEGSSLLIGGTMVSQRAYVPNDSTFYILTETGDSTWNFKKRVIRTRR